MTPEIYHSSLISLPLGSEFGVSDFSRFNRTVIPSGDFTVSEDSKFYDGSVKFNGTDTMIEFLLDNFDIVTENYTLGFWVNFKSYLSGGALFSEKHEPVTTDRIPLTICFTNGTDFGNGNVLTIGYWTGTWYYFTVPEFLFNLNQWYYFSVTRVGRTLTFFLDGYKIRQMEMVVDPLPSLKTFIIGRRWDNAGAQNYFEGEINDFFISKEIAWTNDFTPPGKMIGRVSNETSPPVRLITGEPVDTEVLVFPRNSTRVFRGEVTGGYYSLHAPAVESDMVFLSPVDEYPDLCFSKITPC